MQDFHSTRARSLLDHAEEIVDEAAVQAAVRQIAGELNARFADANEESFPMVLGVMGGAVVFTGHLLPQLHFPLEFDYIHVSRAGDQRHSARRTIWEVEPRPDVVGRTIIVLDDILDDGETLAQVKRRLLEMGAAEVIIAVFATKTVKHPRQVKADINGLTIADEIVVGFGMDLYGYWRNLPGLWAIRQEELELI